MSVGTKIKHYRKRKKLTGSELAEIIGVTQGMISQYESDRVRLIPDDTLQKLAGALDCSVEELTSDDIRYNPQMAPDFSKYKEDSFYIEKIIHLYSKLPANVKEAINQVVVTLDSE